MMPQLPDVRARRGIHGDLVRELATQIVGGTLAPGTQLDLEVLASDAHVSRTSLREALKTLEAKGLVEARPRWGTRVRGQEHWNILDADIIAWLGNAKVGAEFLEELAAVRETIEPAAARLAASNASRQDAERIREAFEAFALSVETDVDRIVDCDVAFHVSILEASGNRFFRHMAPLLSAALRGRDRVVLAEPRRRRRDGLMVDAHERVLAAILDRKPDEAEQFMRVLTERAGKDARAAVTSSRRRVSRK